MLLPVLLTLLVVLYRVVLGCGGSADTTALQWLHNFSPLASVALCGAAFFPRRAALALPLGALFLSDLCLNVHYGIGLVSPIMIPQYVALGAIAGLGLLLRRNPSLGRLLLGSLAGSAFFYLVTNTGAWLANPEYASSFAGWLQALTSGVPGHPSTLVFFRNSVVSDLLFTGLFVVSAAGRPAMEAQDFAGPDSLNSAGTLRR